MKTILVILIAYLIGSLSPSYYFGKIFRNMDIRDYGSGNAGTTNALRVFGKKVGVLTFVLDIVKGVIAVLIGKWILGFNGQLLAAIFVVLGHNWPIFLNFKGGKGIATSFGILLVIHWQIGLIAFVIFITVILLSKYVSLGSITATLFSPIALMITNRTAPIKLHLTMIFLASLAIYRHKDNIKRLLKGEENKIGSIKG